MDEIDLKKIGLLKTRHEYPVFLKLPQLASLHSDWNQQKRSKESRIAWHPISSYIKDLEWTSYDHGPMLTNLKMHTQSLRVTAGVAKELCEGIRAWCSHT